jgi:PAS domain S-box-containing protein
LDLGKTLDENDRLFKQIVENLEDVFWLRTEERFLYVSPSYERVWGRRCQSLYEDPTSHLRGIHPEDRAQLLKNYNYDRFHSEEPFSEIFRVLRPDGSVRWIQTRSLPIKEHDGRILKRAGIARDISDLKKTEQDLKVKENAIGSSINAIAMIDPDGKITYVNRSFLRLWAYDRPEQVMGRSAVEFWQGESAAQNVLERLLAEGSWVGELTGRRRDGSEFTAQISASLVVGENGTPVCGMASFLDVTEKMRLEEQLRQARKLEAVGRLAGGLAHDFNNILTVVKGFSELLEHSIDEKDPRRGEIEEIKQAAQRGSTLIRQLLAFSRRQRLKPRLLNLNDLVRNMTRLLERLIGENVELVTCLDPNLAMTRVDPGQIEQVLVNLVVNGAESMGKGGTLTIQTFNSRENRRPLVGLRVTDTGSGMDKETLSRIFDPFFTTKDPSRGTGLGLATVFGIVEQSGGTISVNSAPGRGSSFTVLLPQHGGPGEAMEASQPVFREQGGSETVLLVEDAHSVRKLARESLKARGYTVMEAANGAQALDLCSQYGGGIDLLITDIVMPGMNGVDLAAALSAQSPRTKVLYISGYPDRMPGGSNGVTHQSHFLPKPFSGGELSRKVREVLHGS